ncbi:thiolase family protein [Rubinisphaera sp.]|uniref:thiolase family protein n=1 Tax=Rubinisphaera sp. TaxID=2024857 RepID=UPI000C0FBD72|nr:thiolase family protein [Rubinisphaera sp.]MBV10770.1 acetyl-CoA C-acyltransferase [Rubinisphaera sp.]HCS55517.1 acetyl-CoA C-acyltransferase [Planctomycetaceae bacterium]
MNADTRSICTRLDPPLAIVAGKRTPFVKAYGALAKFPADQLGVMAVRETLAQINMEPKEIDELVFGSVCGQSDAANVARVIALRAGIPQDRIAHTVNRNCASGMESVIEASQIIREGRAEVLMAGGAESMSQVPFLYNEEAKAWFMKLQRAKSWTDKLSLFSQLRPGHFKPVPQIQLGLTDPVCGLNMGETAEVLASDFDISRNRQDEFALESHRRTLLAQEKGFYNDEILMISGDLTGSAPLQEDLGPRKNQTMESLGKLKPIFRKNSGTVTVGNSCPITDGAVGLVVMSAETAEKRGLKPLGFLHAYSIAGCDPKRMGLGPVFAIDKLLHGTSKVLSDFELVEINEAFAAQVLACLDAMKSADFCKSVLGREEPIGELPLNQLNVNGGAIALGHPVGATGARLILTLLRALGDRQLNQGLASLCVGGGQGVAMWLERA